MNFKELNGKTIPEAFAEYIKENPQVYHEFELQALKAIQRGATKISSKAIINWLRWEFFIKTTDKNFKINDAFTPHFARRFIERHPRFEEYFETRKLRTEEPGPYMVNEDGQITFL